MFEFPSTVVLRHNRENLKKCSLRGLESREDMIFYRYPQSKVPSYKGYVILSMEGQELSREDAELGIFLVDGTWRYAERMCRSLPMGDFVERSLPRGLRTAYPRKQEDCPDASRGLASVEALYAAYAILGRSVEGLLDNYHWKDEFLELNKEFFANIGV